jgi:hypothetical protein
MRYFRRSGSDDILVMDGDGTSRIVEGPVPGTLGGILGYDDTDPVQANYANQYAVAHGWYECDVNGDQLPPSSREEAEAKGTAPGGGDEPTTANVEEIQDIDEPAPAG